MCVKKKMRGRTRGVYYLYIHFVVQKYTFFIRPSPLSPSRSLSFEHGFFFYIKREFQLSILRFTSVCIKRIILLNAKNGPESM
jgi:hypothetical protein